MKKKILAILMSFVFAFTMFGLSGCGEEEAAAPAEAEGGSGYGEAYDAFAEAVDMDFTLEVNNKIASFGDDEVHGMRSAASPAETETMEYIESVMNDIGLENVTNEEITVDGWTFNGANITFKNAKGKEQKIDLGGYQTTIQADNQEVELVYVNRGTEEDYEGIDVEGKLVLYEINQEEDWWINYPAYQAKAKGALCSIAMREFPEMGKEYDDRVGVQDICGPADAPALAISNKDCKALKKAIKASGKDSIKVTFNADSLVTPNATSHNVWGEIPGKTDDVIYFFAHGDGYFHTSYDDAQGVSQIISIAKAIKDSGYEPEKTLRFCVHGSEEWGRSGSEYDWSIGAYEQIVHTHPEWAEKGFAILNLDGGYTIEGEKNKGTRGAIEFQSFIKDSVGEMNEAGVYDWTYNDLTTGTEDLMWNYKGIPSIVCGDGEGTGYDDVAYHSNYDSFDKVPVDMEGYEEIIDTFGKMALDLDVTKVRPMNFKARIKSFEKSLDGKDKGQFKDVIAEANAAADALQAKMEKVEKSGDQEAANELNGQIQEVYIQLMDSVVGIDLSDVEVEIKHQMYQENIDYLNGTIKALKKGDVPTAYDEYLWGVDWSWYDMFFDEETCDYMKNQLFANRDNTWGAGLIEFPHADTRDIVDSLKAKYDNENADVSEEIEMLKALKTEQTNYLNEIYASEMEGLQKVTAIMQEYAK